MFRFADKIISEEITASMLIFVNLPLMGKDNVVHKNKQPFLSYQWKKTIKAS